MRRIKSILHILNDEESNEIKKNKTIEKQIAQSKKVAKTEVKILLLGSGESGKSTFIRQMRIISNEKFSENECVHYKELIHQNIIQSMKMMLTAMTEFQITLEDENEAHAEEIRNLNTIKDLKMEENIWESLIKLWNDSGIQQCFNRSHEFNLLDSTQYFYDNIERIKSPNYLPDNQDILRSRAVTTGVIEYSFKQEQDPYTYKIIDVSGQRTERRKWMFCFEDVLSIIFVAAISEYNQLLEETDKHNRLLESKNLFESIVNFNWFDDTSFILFFNKNDLLQKKILESHLCDYFPEFEGEKHDAEAAKFFIKDLFMTGKCEDRFTYHFLCATDTDITTRVFDDVKQTIVQRILKNFRLN